MNMMLSVVGASLVFGIVMMLLPVALLVALQVWLCRKSLKLGLILPILSFLLSLLMVFSLGAMQMVTTSGAVVTGGNELVVSGSSDGQVPAEEEEATPLPGQVTDEVQEEHQVSITPGAVGALAGLFLVCNVPTVVFGGIWLHYKGRRDLQADLRKMKIEDLE